MTIEERLVDALRQADRLQVSPDLFARLARSIEEDRAFRRRRLIVAAAVLVGTVAVTAWVGLSVRSSPAAQLFIDGWRLAVAYLAVAAAILVSLAPHIRRFGRSFVDDVFHLTPVTGGRFLQVLDVAYYTAFSGLMMVDADTWELGDTVLLASGLKEFTFRLGFLLLAMGVLHAVNIAILPVLGLVYNSIVRADLRRRAGDAAPPESIRARTMDRNARGFAIGLAVAVGALVLISFLGPGVGLLFGQG